MQKLPVFQKLALWGFFAFFLLAAPNLASAAYYYTGEDNDPSSPGVIFSGATEFEKSTYGYGGAGDMLPGAAGIVTNGNLTVHNTLYSYGGKGSDVGAPRGGAGTMITGNLYTIRSLVAQGGDGSMGQGGHGIYVDGDYLATKGGSLAGIMAKGGDGFGGVGLYVEGNASFGSGTILTVHSPSGFSAPGLHVENDLSFAAGSRLIMQSEDSRISVHGDVSLEKADIYLLTTLIAVAGDAPALVNFMQGGMVDRGNLPENLDGPILEQEFTEGSSPMIAITVKKDLADFLDGKQRPVLAAIREHYLSNFTDFPLDLSPEVIAWYTPVLDSMYQPDEAGVTRTFDRFYKSLGSENTANTYRGIYLGHQQAREITMAMGNTLNAELMMINNPLSGIFQNKNNLHPQNENRIAKSASLRRDPQALNTASGDTSGGLPMLLWARPFAHFGELDLKDGGHMDQNFYGVSAGFALATEIVTLSLGGHYIRSDFDAPGYDADADTYGLNLSLGHRFQINDWLNPWLDLHFGYSWVELDQDRRDYYGDKASSKPDSEVFSVGFSMDNFMLLTEEFALIPKLGLDYTHIDMESYTESNSSLAMRVNPEDYESLRGELGLAARWLPRDDFNLEARASWYLEMMDTNAELRSRGANMPGVQLVSKGREQGRSSLGLGAGLNWQPTKSIGLGLDYDYLLEEKYQGHQVSATFKFTF